MKASIPLIGTKGHGRSGWFGADRAVVETSKLGRVGHEVGTVVLKVWSRKQGKNAPVMLEMPPSMARAIAQGMREASKPQHFQKGDKE